MRETMQRIFNREEGEAEGRGQRVKGEGLRGEEVKG
jgi:hypothetical protein